MQADSRRLALVLLYAPMVLTASPAARSMHIASLATTALTRPVLRNATMAIHATRVCNASLGIAVEASAAPTMAATRCAAVEAQTMTATTVTSVPSIPVVQDSSVTRNTQTLRNVNRPVARAPSTKWQVRASKEHVYRDLPPRALPQRRVEPIPALPAKDVPPMICQRGLLARWAHAADIP